MKLLSIIIITYNRPDDTLHLLQNIARQNDAGNLLEEVIIINNASTADYSQTEDFIKNSTLPFKYTYSEENYGVAVGRNKAIAQANAPIVVTLDDDAFFKDNDALQNIKNIFSSSYTKENNVGVYCFKVLYSAGRQLQENAFPHKNINRYRHKEKFLTSYYIGCGHAILKEVYSKAGLYPADFFYGMEEYDLGYRILNAGYSIAYNNAVTILHNESPAGRSPHAQKMQMMWVNKTKVAYRYLPKPYFYSTAIMWSLLVLKKTSFNIKVFMHGWQKIMRIPHTEKREPLRRATLHYIKKVGGRLWY